MCTTFRTKSVYLKLKFNTTIKEFACYMLKFSVTYSRRFNTHMLNLCIKLTCSILNKRQIENYHANFSQCKVTNSGQ